ncbi:hypothetical protein [Argonema galeatum]|nr:hypothetical protein [Argonema galeatum]MCL1468942.1 hypothetical protein [Argonema galeatum A003/A1]
MDWSKSGTCWELRLLQDAGEDLELILGKVLEAKMNANQLKTRLEI